MATLHLTLSEAFTPDIADSLARSLDRYINTEVPEIYYRKPSADAADGAPQFIHAVAQSQLWQGALGRAANSYLDLIGRRNDAIDWNIAGEALARPEITPLSEVAHAFAAARDCLPEGAAIVVGLNLPNDRFGTVVVIDRGDPARIAQGIARFVCRCQEISTVIERAIVIGEIPLGPALLTMQDDGAVMIRWNSRADMQAHQARLEP